MAVQGYQLITFEWCMIVLTASFIGLRLYVRNFYDRLYPNFDWTDFFILVAWVSFLSQASMDSVLNHMGFFDPDIDQWSIGSDFTLLTAFKIYYVENATYMNCMYAIKCCMLCMFRNLIPRSMKKTNLAFRITTVTVIVSWVGGFILSLTYCFPISRNWSRDDLAYCAAMDEPVVVGVTVTFHLLTDLMLYLLPLPVIKTAMLPTKQKVGVVVTFGCGFLCVFFAAAVWAATYMTTSLPVIYAFTVMEQTWAVIVACVPAFKRLIVGQKRRTRIAGYSTGGASNRRTGNGTRTISSRARTGAMDNMSFDDGASTENGSINAPLDVEMVGKQSDDMVSVLSSTRMGSTESTIKEEGLEEIQEVEVQRPSTSREKFAPHILL